MPLLFVQLSTGFRIDALNGGCSFDIINESYTSPPHFWSTNGQPTKCVREFVFVVPQWTYKLSLRIAFFQSEFSELGKCYLILVQSILTQKQHSDTYYISNKYDALTLNQFCASEVHFTSQKLNEETLLDNQGNSERFSNAFSPLCCL